MLQAVPGRHRGSGYCLWMISLVTFHPETEIATCWLYVVWELGTPGGYVPWKEDNTRTVNFITPGSRIRSVTPSTEVSSHF